MAVSAGTAAGLGSILDTAVKRAVSHLASVPDPAAPDNALAGELVGGGEPGGQGVDKGPSRVDFLYYEGAPPLYDYYYDTDYPTEPVAPADSLLSPPDVSPPPWAAHLTPRPPHWLQHKDRFRPRPAPLAGNHLRRQDRVSSAVTSLTAYLPALIILPIIAATSYYLIVLNGPTPVVKERWGEGVWEGEWREGGWEEGVARVARLLTTLWQGHQES